MYTRRVCVCVCSVKAREDTLRQKEGWRMKGGGGGGMCGGEVGQVKASNIKQRIFCVSVVLPTEQLTMVEIQGSVQFSSTQGSHSVCVCVCDVVCDACVCAHECVLEYNRSKSRVEEQMQSFAEKNARNALSIFGRAAEPATVSGERRERSRGAGKKRDIQLESWRRCEKKR